MTLSTILPNTKISKAGFIQLRSLLMGHNKTLVDLSRAFDTSYNTFYVMVSGLRTVDSEFVNQVNDAVYRLTGEHWICDEKHETRGLT